MYQIERGCWDTQINLIIFKKFQIYQKKIKIGENLANILFCLITIRLHYIWKSLLNAGLFFLKYISRCYLILYKSIFKNCKMEFFDQSFKIFQLLYGGRVEEQKT